MEVLSPSTEAYDRGEKFDHYKQIASLAQCVFVSHRARTVEVWTRGDGEWTAQVYHPGSDAALQAIRANLRVSELYDAALGPL